MRVTSWRFLIENLKNKLVSWKSQQLSLGGRLALLNSMLSNLLVFIMSTYLIPKSVIKMIDSIRKGFL